MYDFLQYDSHRTGIAVGRPLAARRLRTALYAGPCPEGIMRAADAARMPRRIASGRDVAQLLNDSAGAARRRAIRTMGMYAVWKRRMTRPLEISNAGAVQPLI